MAQSTRRPLPSSVTDDSTSRPEIVEAINNKTANGYDDNDSKGDENGLQVLGEAAAIPKGTVDPVYEAKARVLNHAVSFPECLFEVRF